jgi:hypothetical protein
MTETTMKNQEILNSLNEKIKAAEEALLYLNQSKAGLERVIANSAKTPVEEAYKKVYGVYPIDSIDKTWDPFQAGYNAAKEISSNNHQQVEEPRQQTLYNVIADWWDEIFMNGNPSGQNIESLVEQIVKLLPDSVVPNRSWDYGYNAYRRDLLLKFNGK